MAAPTTVFGIKSDIAAGLLLALAAVLGVASENIGALSVWYDRLLGSYATVEIEGNGLSKPLLLWINDGLMALFFLYVALEIKREIREGALSSWSSAALPVYGAIGGIVLPALVFIGIVGLESEAARGWAIPAATDIAFALGVLSLFGDRVPPLLKTFLLALAVVDDLAAIVIIAAFYTADLSFLALGIASVCCIALFVMNQREVRNGVAFAVVGAVLWAAVLKSGVHATLAGVVIGFAVPMTRTPGGYSLARDMEHDLAPWVSFAILPIFAFANAGVPLGGLGIADLTAPLTLAIALGLFVGKQIGVFGMVFAAVKLGLAQRHPSLSWMQLYGAACLAGIGFTMSLFIGSLAFATPEMQNMVRLGVICGSLASGLWGAAVLMMAPRPDPVLDTAQEAS